jgi:hypothetical protein
LLDADVDTKPELTRKRSSVKYLPTDPEGGKHGKGKKKDEAQLAYENEMKEVTDKQDDEELKRIEDKKKLLEKEGFLKRLSPYNKPFINVIFGLIVSCIQGCIFPVFGIFLTKMLFSLMIIDKDKMRSESNAWCLYMFLCAVVCWCTTFT